MQLKRWKIGTMSLPTESAHKDTHPSSFVGSVQKSLRLQVAQVVDDNEVPALNLAVRIACDSRTADGIEAFDPESKGHYA